MVASIKTSLVQRSTNRADSLRESLYLVQYSIVRLYEIWPPLGDTDSESQNSIVLPIELSIQIPIFI